MDTEIPRVMVGGMWESGGEPEPVSSQDWSDLEGRRGAVEGATREDGAGIMREWPESVCEKRGLLPSTCLAPNGERSV